MKKIPVALVTGAGRGIGRGIACHLAKLGMSVGINYAGNTEAALKTVALCNESRIDDQQRFVDIRADIGSKEDRDRLVRETLAEFGGIDALINNAGIAPTDRLDVTQTTEKSYSQVMRTNLDGPFFLTQQVANYWLNKKPAPALKAGFKVIFISSISAISASISRAEYCISKAGLAMAAQLWSIRLAEEGIQVFDLRPGIIATDMTAGVKGKYDKLIQNGLVPQMRWGRPDDVGEAVGSLLVGGFPYSTGSVIYVDGGLYLRKL